MSTDAGGSGRPSTSRGDDVFLEALLSGARIQSAAVLADISERTAYRRLADPSFRKVLEAGRAEIRENIVAQLTEAAGDAVSTLWHLLDHEDPEIRLKAARTLLDTVAKMPSVGPTKTERICYSVEKTC